MKLQMYLDPPPLNICDYVFVHWCDDAMRWKAVYHRFLTTTTKKNIMGQFIVSHWFDCPIYAGKTFMVIQTVRGLRTQKIENIINGISLIDNPFIKVLDTFITPQLPKDAAQGATGFRIVLQGFNPNNTLSLVLRETHLYKTKYPFYCTLPDFNLKID